MKRTADKSGARLSALLHGITEVPQARDVAVTGVSMDTRTLHAGAVFLAVPGRRDHGWRYAAQAVRLGAAAIVADSGGAARAGIPGGIPVFEVPGLAAVAGVIAARFHGEPSRQLRVVGVTGTNGKTSTTHYIAAAMDELTGGHAGVIGTLGYGPAGRLEPAPLTTPDPVTLQAELARQRGLGVQVVAMEVSSHALELGRIAGVHFHTAVFTNLTRDHLDFHGDMKAYGAAKRRLFELPDLGHAVINLGDDFGLELRRACAGRVPVTGYRLVDGPLPDAAPDGVLLGRLRDGPPGSLYLDLLGPWGRAHACCALTGRFNAENLLATCATLCTMAVPFEHAVALLAHARAVPGRMEAFRAPGRPLVVVDYAHTPDAVRQALATLRPQCRGRLVCVFGCGGDRDPGKRPQMGAVVEIHADLAVITSDNPRSEDPGAIIDAIRSGMKEPGRALTEPDRARAIRRAVGAAGVDDIVLVAGKGHETWQEIAGKRVPFSDRALVRSLLEGAP